MQLKIFVHKNYEFILKCNYFPKPGRLAHEEVAILVHEVIVGAVVGSDHSGVHVRIVDLLHMLGHRLSLYFQKLLGLFSHVEQPVNVACKVKK